MIRFWTLRLALLIVLLSGCTTARETDPQRTATEQLLISTAADRAAAAMRLDVGPDRKCFLDATNFEGIDGKYAVAAIRSSLLKQGTRFVPDQKLADTIIEIRSGALSINKSNTLVGIPAIPLPIPLTEGFATPEIAIYKSEEQEGIAKFAATAYDAKDGQFLDESNPPLGRSHIKRKVLLSVSWIDNDVHAEAAAPEPQESRRFNLGRVEP